MDLKGSPAPLTAASFSPDGRRIVTASTDKTARIWDAETGKTVAILAGHSNWVESARFSTDGRHVVTSSSDKTARVWDTESGKTIAILSGHTGGLWNAAFSPDGSRVVTASDDETARIWRLYPNTQALVDDAKNAVPRCLTHDERERFFLGPEPPAWCIEMAKWPHVTQEWKDWLRAKREDLNPPLPVSDSLSVQGDKLAAQDNDQSTVQQQPAQKPRLGVAMSEVSADLAASQHLSSTDGAVIVKVLPDSAAMAADLRAGDVILQVNGKPIKNSAEVTAAVNSATASHLDILVRRGEQTMTLKAILSH
jgi:PDZ domain/WD domain, G-beta repeat